MNKIELESTICTDHELYNHVPKTYTEMNSDLYKYILDVSLREPSILSELREETALDKNSIMQISQDQGQFLSLLIKIIDVKKAIEIGTFTGYSSLSVAMALPEDGKLIACDVSEKWTNIAQKYWKKAGVDHKITLKINHATETLKNLYNDGEAESFDFALIDADKINQEAYYEAVLLLLKPGGIIAIDNVLWFNAVLDKNKLQNDKDTISIDALNRKLLKDHRIDLSLIPIGDGLTLIRKR